MRNAAVTSAGGLGVDPLWGLPGDIWSDGGSHVLHDGLDPVATDSRGHGRQGARFLLTLDTERKILLTPRILPQF